MRQRICTLLVFGDYFFVLLDFFVVSLGQREGCLSEFKLRIEMDLGLCKVIIFGENVWKSNAQVGRVGLKKRVFLEKR